MHELTIIARVLDLATARAPPGTEIVRIRLRVGYLCDAEPLWLERYFRLAARGTPAERAELVVTRRAGPTAINGAAGRPAGAWAEAPDETSETPAAAGASGPGRPDGAAGRPAAGRPEGARGTVGMTPGSGEAAADDEAFGYVLESIEVRDAPRRNGP